MFGRALFYAAVLVAIYIGVLVYFDQRSGVFASIGQIGAATLPVALFSLVAFSVRYARWRWLLERRGSNVPMWPGLLGYLAGFALTASPAKIGELIRIRYFAAFGVPAERVVACLFFERASDIIVLLALSLFMVGFAGFWLASGFALFAVCAVAAMLRLAQLWPWPARRLRRHGWRMPARLVRLIGRGIAAAMPFFRPWDLCVSLAFGLVIYGLHSLSFLYLTHSLNVSVPLAAAFGLYPLATLIGAASMLPGGVGTTEVAMILLLRQLGVSLDAATVTSLAMRLASTWLAIALGLMSAAYLEFNRRQLAKIAG